MSEQQQEQYDNTNSDSSSERDSVRQEREWEKNEIMEQWNGSINAPQQGVAPGTR